jgi:hypothetical protein
MTDPPVTHMTAVTQFLDAGDVRASTTAHACRAA